MSDRHYFGWLADALGGFERATGEISAAAAGTRAELWVLAGARMNPAIEIVRDALGAERTAIRFLDRFQRGPDVTAVDVNELGAIPDDACDVLMMTRASYMVQEPRAFLAGLSRIVRPGGLAIVDWIHGAADAPRLDLPGHHEYEGRRHPLLLTHGTGTSRAVYDALGHDVRAYASAAHRALLMRAANWLLEPT